MLCLTTPCVLRLGSNFEFDIVASALRLTYNPPTHTLADKCCYLSNVSPSKGFWQGQIHSAQGSNSVKRQSVFFVLLTCVHNHLRWWWGWSAWPSGTQSRCSSTWRPCCCGGSRTCRSCCLRAVDSESRNGNAPCGQSRVRTLGNEPRGLQIWERQRLRCNIYLKFSLKWSERKQKKHST